MAKARLFTETDLLHVAGERSFDRGRGYLKAVADLEIGEDVATATVYGTDVYAVELDLGDGGVTGDGFIEYADAFAYSCRVDEVVGVIEGLIDGGRADEAAALAGQALSTVVEALTQADDSNGSIGASAQELAGAHARACDEARVDPVGLGQWLAGFVLGEGQMLDLVHVDAYHDALGEPGMSEYRRLITEAWRDNPSGWNVKYLMEGLLRADGDVDALIGMYAAELLPSGYTHLRIAGELDRAGRAGEALEWAERGVREAAENADTRLVDYLAARHEAAGELGKLMDVRQDAFDRGRTLGNYRALREAAQKTGQWDEIRVLALRRLRSDATAFGAGRRVAGARGGAVFGWGMGPVWIDALIDDGDIAAAWDAAAGGASEQQWRTLADLISDDRPADALPVYLRAIEPLRSQTGDPVYQQVADLLTKIKGCHGRLGTADQFTAYLAALRTDQKRKRNLMKLLDQRGV